jgi:hypothetical protein
MVKRCWSSLSLEPVCQKLLSKESAWELIIEVLSMEEKTCIKTMLLLWKWWSLMNKINKGENGMSGDEGAAAVLQLMGDLGVNEKQAPVSQGATPARWSAPP